MKVIPLKGHVVLMKVKLDYIIRGKLILPAGEKSSTFFNRAKVVAMPPDAENYKFKVGDIVVTTNLSGQLGVPGQITDENEDRREVILSPIDQVVGILEGDKGELEEITKLPPIIETRGGGNGSIK